MLAMDKQDYIEKTFNLLSDINTYMTINKDPTTRLRNQLINTLKDIKQQENLMNQHKKVYPTSTIPLNFYGIPKIHKGGTTLDL